MDEVGLCGFCNPDARPLESTGPLKRRRRNLDGPMGPESEPPSEVNPQLDSDAGLDQSEAPASEVSEPVRTSEDLTDSAELGENLPSEDALSEDGFPTLMEEPDRDSTESEERTTSEPNMGLDANQPGQETPEALLSALDPIEKDSAQARSTPRTTAELEQRVRRLEEVLSLIQQGKPFNLNLPARSAPINLPPQPAPAPTPVPTARIVTELPVATPVPSAPTAPPRPAPSLGIRGPVWLFWDMLIEVRVFWRLYTDPRYQLSWFGRLCPPALLIIFIFSNWFFMPLASIPFLGPWLDRICMLVVAYILFKCLSSEARRYRQTAPDLPPSLRL